MSLVFVGVVDYDRAQVSHCIHIPNQIFHYSRCITLKRLTIL